MTEQATQVINIKQLADQAGVKPSHLRRIIRAIFPRETKGKVYEWQPDDPQIGLILEAVKNHQVEPKIEKPKAKQVKAKAQPKKQAKPKSEKQTEIASKG